MHTRSNSAAALLLASALLALPTAASAQQGERLPADRIETLREEMARLERSWRAAQGEEGVLYYDLLELRGDELDAALASLVEDPEALSEELRSLAVEALKDRGERLAAWSGARAAEIADLRRELPDAPPERSLEIEQRLSSTNDELDRLLTAQVANLERLEAMGETPDPTALDASLERRAELDAARIRRALAELAVAEDRIASSAGDAKATAELRATALREKLRGSTSTLENVAGLLERRGRSAASYREVLLEATGQLTVESLDAEVALTTVGGLIQAARDAIRDHWATVAFRLVVFVTILMLSAAIGRACRGLLERSFARHGAGRSTLLGSFVSRTASRLIFFFGLVVALWQVGIDIAPFLAGLGVAGLVLGLALQDTLSNLFSGLMILLLNPYDVDDVVEAGGVSGTVHTMNLVNTTILTFDNKKLIVPNRKIWADTIQNVTAQQQRRVDLEIGVSYSDDVDRVAGVLKEVVTAHEKVLAEPAPNIRLHRLDDSAVTFIVRPWVAREDYWSVYWDLMRSIKLRFDAEGISIPFPQRDVHVIEAPPQKRALHPARASADAGSNRTGENAPGEEGDDGGERGGLESR